MKVTKFPATLTDKYLRLLATYRRYLRKDISYSYYRWDIPAMVECFEWESYGNPLEERNGYAQGKWQKDLMFSMWVEDIQKGNAVKAEFYTSMNKWWLEKAFRDIIIHVPFWMEDRTYVRRKLSEADKETTQ